MVVKNVEKKENNTAIFQVEIDAEAFEQAGQQGLPQAEEQHLRGRLPQGQGPARWSSRACTARTSSMTTPSRSSPTRPLRFACREENLDTVGTPSVADYNVDENKVCTVTFTTDLYPVVTLGEYKGLEVPYADARRHRRGDRRPARRHPQAQRPLSRRRAPRPEGRHHSLRLRGLRRRRRLRRRQGRELQPRGRLRLLHPRL